MLNPNQLTNGNALPQPIAPVPVVLVPDVSVASGTHTNREPTALAAGVEAAIVAAIGPEASAYGSAVTTGSGQHAGLPTSANAMDVADQANDTASQIRAMAAMVDLVSSLDGASGLEDAADRLARNLATYLGGKRLFVVWRKAGQRQLSVIADTTSVHDDQEKRSQYRLVTAAGEEIVARGEFAQWPPKEAKDRHA